MVLSYTYHRVDRQRGQTTINGTVLFVPRRFATRSLGVTANLIPSSNGLYAAIDTIRLLTDSAPSTLGVGVIVKGLWRFFRRGRRFRQASERLRGGSRSHGLIGGELRACLGQLPL